MVLNVAGALGAYKQSGLSGLTGDGASAASGGVSFGETLQQFVGDGLKAVKEGEQAVKAGALGKADMQSVVMAVDKAGQMLETVTALRDKIIGAYQEIIRMPI